MYKYKVSILGTGFIGLCSAACFADKDIKILASTHNERKAALINDGKAPFFAMSYRSSNSRVEN